MVRIRYKRDNESDTLVSRPVLTGHDAVRVVLMPAALEYNIVSLDGEHVLTTGKAVSVQMLKIEAKHALKTLGAVFDDEIRKKTILTA